MNWLLLTFAVLAAWAILRVLGGERQRQVQDLQTEIMNAASKNAAAAQKSSSR
jgi:hypothetical protein